MGLESRRWSGALTRHPRSGPPRKRRRNDGQKPMPYPCPSSFRLTEAVYGDPFFADRAETHLETSKRPYFGLDPL